MRANKRTISPSKLCPKCGVFTPSEGCAKCLVCKRSYHKLCANLNWPIIPEIWNCPACTNAAAIQQLQPITERSPSSILINTPGQSLLVIETPENCNIRKDTLADIDGLPTEQEIKYVNTRRGKNRIKFNIPVHNSFCSLSTDDDDEQLVADSLNKRCRDMEEKIKDLEGKLQEAINRINDVEKENRHIREQLAITPPLSVDSKPSIPVVKPIIQQPDTTKFMKKSTSRPIPGNNIVMLGDQQLKNMATTMIDLRSSYSNKAYNVLSFVKPYATSSQILENSILTELRKDDIIVLAVGANENHQQDLIDALTKTFDKLKDNVVFLLGVRHSKLDEILLNRHIKSLVSKYPNVNMIDVATKLFVKDICFKLNIEIDYLEYKKTFIDNVKSHLYRANVNCLKLKKGTISYLFKMQADKAILLTSAVHKEIPTIGTIPYYFQQLRSKQKSKSTVKPLTHPSDTFFRP